MSILECPVCRSQMREIDRDGVQIDICTQCRGVWLDRGELEKLSNVMSGGSLDKDDRQRGRDRNERPKRGGSWFGDGDDDRDDDDDDRRGGGAPSQRPRTRGFLDFFD